MRSLGGGGRVAWYYPLSQTEMASFFSITLVIFMLLQMVVVVIMIMMASFFPIMIIIYHHRHRNQRRPPLSPAISYLWKISELRDFLMHHKGVKIGCWKV